MTQPILGLILAGGLARRMGGGDKPLLRLGGRTLLDRVVERLSPQCGAGLVLSANGDPTRFAGFPGPILPDGIPGHPGPLAGILAALDFAAEHGSRLPSSNPHPHPEVVVGISRVVSVSSDAPFIPYDLVDRLHAALDADDPRIALAASEKKHYTVALWPISLRHDLRAALVERDERRVGAFVARHGAVVVSWPTEPSDPFLNINEPDDLAAAEAVLADPDKARLLR
ncbi:molybdenum cofactor guanylyltransferase MobA [Methylobacterium brachythecii]|uniref:Molybdenum cofactor guanylyltransferase n=1 Tax=Methylobacterium brachythecii TaxID=1176177 RepID=A0A7W6F6F5_9HYPH|nr:molybdenum cofactor guanylyltransferase MobA [Methylobacterium brachythecii]MBB3902268.1 molybdopterin-guanine dinucleotide biosynthesis protein A [Methylobacterium brachythecii]GLS42115.1 molybdenum cofactor guanylyltransferase [Methylobacterium brachythecii]